MAPSLLGIFVCLDEIHGGLLLAGSGVVRLSKVNDSYRHIAALEQCVVVLFSDKLCSHVAKLILSFESR